MRRVLSSRPIRAQMGIGGLLHDYFMITAQMGIGGLLHYDFMITAQMGIGGLDAEFSDIFRRAFASRLFPAATLSKLGMKPDENTPRYSRDTAEI